ncbi:hypothetical protein ISS96_00500 [Candidatus Bathyarchaeota archaeon]|nr:hypothetical protein [Candidatus Bathyarchaeota archaeon]
MKAGILDLSFSIPVFLIVVLLSTVGFSVWFRYSRNIRVLSKEGEIIDRFQFNLEKVGYTDPCSGNSYPIIDLALATRISLVFHIGSRTADESSYLFLFPILLFSNNRFSPALMGVGEEDAGILIGC